MRFRKIALALLACMALGAFAANAAQAAGWTTGTTENQTTAGTLIPNGTHLGVLCEKHGGNTVGEPLTLSGTVTGIPLTLTATGIDCLEKAGSTNPATIDNTTEANHSEGVLTFTHVTVSPPTCMVPGEELTTKQLTDRVKMDPTVGSAVVFDEFFTHAGVPFIEIELTGAECPFAGIKAPVNGTACGEAVHTNAAGTGFVSIPTGTLTKVQTLLFGKAQQETGGCTLTLGKADAIFSGAVDNRLVSGAVFGSD